MNRKMPLILFLMFFSAFIQAIPPRDLTLLKKAISNGQVKTVEALITKRNIPVDAKDEELWTPLLHAVKAGQKAVVKKLLELGATADYGVHSFIRVRENGKVKEQIYIFGLERDKPAPSIEPAMHLAARKGDLQLVDLLREESIYGLNVFDADRVTPLMIAAEKRNLDFVKGLLDRGALQTEEDSKESVALHYAAYNTTVDGLKIIELLAKKTPLDIPNRFERTPLMEAASRNNHTAVKKLLELGANPDIKTRHGLTALKIAERRQFPESAKIIKEYLGKKG